MAIFCPLKPIEPRLRYLLPADLYAISWVEPSPSILTRVFEHLRTLYYILHDYVPRQVLDNLPAPGTLNHRWQESTLMFTDLAGFTPLMEANARYGTDGAKTLLNILNAYFAEMIEIISKSGGNLLEFTGDAMLAQFESDARRDDTAQAIRAGMRMQRAMQRFAHIETPQGEFSLAMRIGIHTGRFVTADIGTPRRMEHVLLGSTVHHTKLAEGSGKVGRVCLTEAAYERVKDQFRFEPGRPGYMLAVDDFSAAELGEYEIAPSTRRPRSSLLLDRSIEGLVGEIEKTVELIEPLAAFLPEPVLNLLIESAAKRQIPPDFPEPTILFVNLIGLPEAMDRAQPGEEAGLVNSFSKIFAQINAAVEARGGVLKKVTYHLNGSDMMIYFGAPRAHTDDPLRAVEAAVAIREAVLNLNPPPVGGQAINMSCQIGIARGPVFVAEIGEPRGRREFNALGDAINTAARLMGRAVNNQIYMTEAVHERVSRHFDCEPLEPLALKGKSAPLAVFALKGVPDLTPQL